MIESDLFLQFLINIKKKKINCKKNEKNIKNEKKNYGWLIRALILTLFPSLSVECRN